MDDVPGHDVGDLIDQLQNADKYIKKPEVAEEKFDLDKEDLEKFILNNWETYLNKSIVTLVDPKTKLQEYSLKKFKKLPQYTFFKKSGPQHNPLFKTEVQITGSKKVIGKGSSKKNAQQDAASKLIVILKL